MNDERLFDLTSAADTTYTSPTSMYGGDPDYLQAQQEALQRFEVQQQQQRNQNHSQLLEEDDESAALAAAIAASEHEHQQEQMRRQQRQQEAEQERQRQRELERQRQEQEQLEFARQLQRDEECLADNELAQALEASSHEAHAQKAQQSINQSLEQRHLTRSQERNAGSWDCGQCTFENLPYAPRCEACRHPPPPGTLVFQTISKNQKFGVELEVMVTNGHKDGITLDWMAKQLTKLGPPHVEYRGYTHEVSEHWKIVTDASLRGHNTHDLCLELVSPVLQGPQGLVQLRTMMEHLRQLGIATNKTCGFHVHIDATHLSLKAIKNIATCFVALENAFDLLVAKNHRTTDDNRYCRSNRIAFGQRSNQQRWRLLQNVTTMAELVSHINPDRNRKLNLTNLVNPNRPSTMEFRLHGGVEELREAEAWVRLLVRFCRHAALEANATNVLQLKEEASPADELVVLWSLVQCPGLEQFYTLDRRLYNSCANNNSNNNKNNKTNKLNVWRCRTCRRPFQTSRALAQHVDATGHY